MTKPPKIPESVLVVIHTPELDVLVIERADHKGFWQSVTGSKDRSTNRSSRRPRARWRRRRASSSAATLVPQRCLLDWHHRIEYDIYPQWRHRYAEGVTHNTEHQFSLLVPALPRSHARAARAYVACVAALP